MLGPNLRALLEASIELANLRKENRRLREELAEARRPQIDFALSAEALPSLLRRQAE